MGRWLAPLLVALTLIAAPRPALADGDEATSDTTVLVASIVGGLIGAGGLVGGVGNTLQLIDEERSPLGWQVVGFSFGGLNLLGGAWIVANTADEPDAAFALGITAIVLGAAEIAITALAATQEVSNDKVTVNIGGSF